MKKLSHFLLLIILLISAGDFARGQSIADSCFTSANIGASFNSGANLYNSYTNDSDLVEWDGSNWIGGISGANLTIPPPTNQVGCRAIFIGSGLVWTSGGESFEFQLSTPMVAGQTYSFDFTYVSHGVGSTGAFSPLMFTNTAPGMAGAFQLPNLPPVGFTWTTNTITFTADPSQNGHDVIIIFSGMSGASGSGMFNSFCETCNVPSPCSIDLGSDLTLCDGETTVLDATTLGMSYLWQDGSTNPTLNVTQAGTYWVEITNGNCNSSDTVIVDYTASPTPNLGNDTLLCIPATLTLDATQNNASYVWSDGTTTPTLDVVQTGTYWVDITVDGCTGSDTIEVVIANNLSVNLGNDTSICIGNTFQLDVSSTSGSYLWQDGSTNSTFNATQSGTYWVEINSGTCTGSDTIVVSETTLDIAMFTNDTLSCQVPYDVQFIGEVSTNATGNISWLWNFGDSQTSTVQNPTHSYLSAGNYTVSLTVTTNNGCSQTINHPDWIELLVSPTANFSFSPNSPTTFESEVNFTNLSSNETSWSWDFGDGNSSLDENPSNEFPSVQGNYIVTLTVFNDNGCSDSIKRIVHLEDIIIFYVPNSFTPNGDEFNNTFGPVVTVGVDVNDFNMTIYNRWGQVIFESTDVDGRWDGTYRGNDVQDGTYTWVIEFQEVATDKRQVHTGHVNLMR